MSLAEVKEFLHEIKAPANGIYFIDIARNVRKKRDITISIFFNVKVGEDPRELKDIITFRYSNGKFDRNYDHKYDREGCLSPSEFFEIFIPVVKNLCSYFIFTFDTWDAIDEFLKLLPKSTIEMLDGLCFYEPYRHDQTPLSQKFKVRLNFNLERAAVFCRNSLNNEAPAETNRVLFVSDLPHCFGIFRSRDDYEYTLKHYPKMYDKLKMLLYTFSRAECYLSDTPFIYPKLQNGNSYMQNLLKMFFIIPYGLTGEQNTLGNFLVRHRLHDPRLLLLIEEFIRPNNI